MIGVDMKPNYSDIILRIGTMPLWFDENAVPRYCEFSPDRSASIYVGEIALAEITCQACGYRFLVAFSVVNHDEGSIADAIKTRTLHYGDPPAHEWPGSPYPECMAGDSENSEPRRILQYWRRYNPRHGTAAREYVEWERDVSFECDIQPAWVARSS